MLKPLRYKIYLYCICIACCLLFSALTPSKAATFDSDTLPQRGIVKGLVIDSALNFVLNRATVAIYTNSDSSLINYVLPNEDGLFSLGNLPIETSMQLVITHVGYQPLFRNLKLQKNEPSINLGRLSLLKKTDTGNHLLDEVIVHAVAPVRFNGDTLEFEPNAFRLDSNATAEDLIRKLPGFTIWADGQVTYNGKEVHSVLVDGKPFFGGGIEVAMRNVPKDAIDKLQLYQSQSSNKQSDSSLHANLKLKKDKNSGYLGKLYAAHGTSKRYSASGMLGYFNPQLQISTVADFNNINNSFYNIRQLISRSTYQNAGNDLGYQPEFRTEGINVQAVAGAMFQKDYFAGIAGGNEKRADGSYLFRKNNFSRQSDLLTTRVVDSNNIQLSKEKARSESRSVNHTANGAYKRIKPGYYEWNSAVNWERKQVSETNSFQTEVSNNTNAVQSVQLLGSESTSDINKLEFSTSYLHKLNPLSQGYKKGTLSVNYNMQRSWSSGDQMRTSTFESLINAAQNQRLIRFYNTMDRSALNNQLTVGFDGLEAYIVPGLIRHKVSLSVQNDLGLEHTTLNDEVLDLNSTTNSFTLNNYMTNTATRNVVNIQPSFTIRKIFNRILNERYTRNLSLFFTAKSQYYELKNRSIKDFQNFSFNYLNFVPATGFSYNKTRNNQKSFRINVGYAPGFNYPDEYMIAPLIDSMNQFYQRIGNSAIGPEKDHKFSLGMDISIFKTPNHADIKFHSNIGWVKDKITDQVIFDNLGRGRYMAVNAGTEKYVSGTLEIRKKLTSKKSTTIVSAASNVRFYESPNIVNGMHYITTFVYGKSSIQIDFDRNGKYNLHGSGGIETNKTALSQLDNISFIQRNFFATAAGGVTLSSRLFWSLNATHNINTVNGQEVLNNTIVNSALSYRLFARKQGEIRFSALDILRQNTGYINQTTGYGQVFGNVNVLQQYFLMSFAYYPRKFGR